MRETIAYLAEHLELEPWGAQEPVGLLTASRGRAATCPECDAPVSASDTYCRRCGTPLERARVGSGT